MRTLIFDGSPRPRGDTAALIDALMDGLDGEVIRVRVYEAKISACTDCRYCWEKPGCAMEDDMQAVYHEIDRADAIVIASPIYFSELTGPLLSVMSRLQTLYCARAFRNDAPARPKKAGGVLLAGGGDGSAKKAEETARTLLHQMNARCLGVAASLATNVLPAGRDDAAKSAARALARAMTTDCAARR